MNRLFLVDTEKTNDYSFIKILDLDPGDCVYLLYSSHSKNVCVDFIRYLIDFGGTIEFLKVNNGRPNELDFQLCTLLGTLVDKFRGSVDEYYLISNDMGFSSSINLLKSLYPSININLYNNGICIDKLLLTELLCDYNLDKITIGKLCCALHNSRDLQSLHNNIKAISPNIVGDVYPILKKNLDNLIQPKPYEIIPSVIDSSLTLFNGGEFDPPRPSIQNKIVLDVSGDVSINSFDSRYSDLSLKFLDRGVMNSNVSSSSVLDFQVNDKLCSKSSLPLDPLYG